MAVTDTSVSESEEMINWPRDIEWVKTWFKCSSDPPKQMWKEVLHRLPGYTIKAGYIRDRPEFCYLSVTDRRTQQSFLCQK